MKTKKCPRCGIEKILSDFYKNTKSISGVRVYCIQCEKEKSSLRHGYFNEYMKKRYRENEEFRIIVKNREKLYEENNKEKKRAHKIVSYYLKNGDITKQPCVFCNSAESEAHHPDYTKPLLIVWVCSKHHKVFHNKR